MRWQLPGESGTFTRFHRLSMYIAVQELLIHRPSM